MQIYVKLFTFCHHAPIKIVYMTFREKMTSSDKSFALRLAAAVHLSLCLNAAAQAHGTRPFVSDSLNYSRSV